MKFNFMVILSSNFTTHPPAPFPFFFFLPFSNVISFLTKSHKVHYTGNVKVLLLFFSKFINQLLLLLWWSERQMLLCDKVMDSSNLLGYTISYFHIYPNLFHSKNYLHQTQWVYCWGKRRTIEKLRIVEKLIVWINFVNYSTIISFPQTIHARFARSTSWK